MNATGEVGKLSTGYQDYASCMWRPAPHGGVCLGHSVHVRADDAHDKAESDQTADQRNAQPNAGRRHIAQIELVCATAF